MGTCRQKNCSETVMISGEPHIPWHIIAATSRQIASFMAENEYAKEDRGRVTIIAEKYVTDKSIKYIERASNGLWPYMSPNIANNIVKTIISVISLS